METFSLLVSGVRVDLSVDDSGATSDEVLGDAVYRFEGDLARLLAPMRLATYTADFSRAFERTLGECAEDATGEAFDPEVDDVLALSVDAGIAAVALLLDRGEPFAYSVDLAEGSAYWAFHDLGHAVEDCGGDWAEGLADFPPVGSWAEDRANLEGARRALRAGLDLDEVLGALVGLRGPFAERFDGEESTALDDLLAGGLDFLGEDAPDLSEGPAHVEALARDLLESNPDADLDDLSDLANEYADGDGFALSRPGFLLASLPDFADSFADVYGRDEVADLETRAAIALDYALGARVRELAECSDCRDARRAPGLETCAECADA